MPPRFSIGYYRENEWGDSIKDLLIDYPDVKEVYFPLPDQHSGRHALNLHADTDIVTQELLDDLCWIQGRGIALNLLLNAGCYSAKVQDASFLDGLKKKLVFYVEDLGVSSVTTTQPSFALLVKRLFGNRIDVRASINMSIASIDAMRYLSRDFDSFYPARELYRSFDELIKWREWADKNGKRLHALVNSGCLAYCPWAASDNNAVAHGIVDYFMADRTPIPTCHDWFSENPDASSILKGCFIRPEDIGKYSEIFDGFKIATRTHFLPRVPVSAYLKGSFKGLITDLLEPCHTHSFSSSVCIPNEQIPDTWFSQTAHCHRKCYSCHYCENLAQSVVVPYLDKYNFKYHLFDDMATLQHRISNLKKQPESK